MAGYTDCGYARAEAAWSADDEARDMIPVYILASRSGAPVTINHPMHKQIIVSQEVAQAIAVALIVTSESGRTIDPRVRVFGKSVVLKVNGARQVYTFAEAIVLSQQISAALQMYQDQFKEVA